jgi:homoserine dehydrogenase
MPGVIGSIGTCFGDYQVSLECIMQKASHAEELAEIVILTHTVREEDLRQAIAKIAKLPMIMEIPSVFRVLSVATA